MEILTYIGIYFLVGFIQFAFFYEIYKAVNIKGFIPDKYSLLTRGIFRIFAFSFLPFYLGYIAISNMGMSKTERALREINMKARDK
jgi:hypothetical protein